MIPANNLKIGGRYAVYINGIGFPMIEVKSSVLIGVYYDGVSRYAIKNCFAAPTRSTPRLLNSAAIRKAAPSSFNSRRF
jgi:hypothetical protein